MRTTTPAPDATPSVASIARYDARLAHDVARRDREHDLAQLARDARRAAYDAAVMAAPITTLMRELRYVNARSDTSGRAFTPRTVRITPPPTPPKRDVDRRTTPNAWEAQGPHARAHLAMDRACHHPLVKCAHKW